MSRVHSCVNKRELIADFDATSGLGAQDHVTLHRRQNRIFMNPEHVGGSSVRDRSPGQSREWQHALERYERLVECDLAELTDNARKRELTELPGLDAYNRRWNHQLGIISDGRAMDKSEVSVSDVCHASLRQLDKD